MKKILILWVILLLFVLSSCSGGESATDKDPGFTFSTLGAGLRAGQVSVFTINLSETNLDIADLGVRFTAKSKLPGDLKLGIHYSTNATNTLRAKGSTITLSDSQFYIKADNRGSYGLTLLANYTVGDDTNVKQMSSNITLNAKDPVKITPSTTNINTNDQVKIEFTLDPTENLEFDDGYVRFHIGNTPMVDDLFIYTTSDNSGHSIRVRSNANTISDYLEGAHIKGGVVTLYIVGGGVNGDYPFMMEIDVKKKGDEDSAKTITALVTLKAS